MNPILSGSFSFRGLCTAMPCRLRREPLRADRKRREKQALAFAEIERSGHIQRLCDLSHECVALCLQQIVERRRSLLRYSGVPKRYFCTFGEKEHTSKRVSVIAPDNAISKAQCATLLRYYANVVCYAPPHLHQCRSPMNTGLQAHRTSSFVTQNHHLTQILFVLERLWILFCFWLSITRKGQSLSFCGRRVRLP